MKTGSGSKKPAQPQPQSTAPQAKKPAQPQPAAPAPQAKKPAQPQPQSTAPAKKPAQPAAPASSAATSAATKPKLVYRADKRPPNEVFSNGFTAYGGPDGEDDLLAHVIGGIKNLEKTAYISTSQSRRVPGAFIKAAFKADGTEDSVVDKRNVEIKYLRRIGWIYTINTTSLDMVYVPDFLQGKDKELKKFGYQQEWAVKGSIPGKNIKEAQHVDGYIWRYSDLNNMPQGVDPIYPPEPGMNPFKETVANSKYAFK